jgi:hypothetical protein
MAITAIELLETCRLAEDIWEHVPERTLLVRAEIDRLWRAYEQGVGSGGDDVDDTFVKLVSLSATLRSPRDTVTLGRVRTDVLLGAWRDAEHALSQVDCGTLAWLVACRAVEATRDAYHARVDVVLARVGRSVPYPVPLNEERPN